MSTTIKEKIMSFPWHKNNFHIDSFINKNKNILLIESGSNLINQSSYEVKDIYIEKSNVVLTFENYETQVFNKVEFISKLSKHHKIKDYYLYVNQDQCIKIILTVSTYNKLFPSK